MKYIILLLSCFFSFSWASPSLASVIDAPHNADNNVHCSSCHTYSFEWQFSPLPKDNPSFQQTSFYNSTTNAMCQSCHNDPAETIAPHKKSTHASGILGQTYGTWEIACIECHDPHFQRQLDWAATIPKDELFLVDGIIGTEGTFMDNGNGTTTFDYSLVSSSPAWSIPSGLTPTDLDWGRKNDNQSMDRGLILVIDNDSNSTTFANSTFTVVSADSSTITIKGLLSASQKTDTADSTFGLIYGQMIQTKIMAPSVTTPTTYTAKDVKFFDPQTVYSNPSKTYGGFVDQNVPRSGICQVCHIATTYWTEDGLTDGTHYPDTSCDACHDRLNGFAQSTDHSVFLSKTGSSCEGCHDRSGTGSIQTDIHGNCSNCHGANKSLIAGARGWGDATLHGPIGIGTTSDCTTCHPNYAGTFQAGHQPPTHSALTTTGCSPCHTGDHSGNLLVDIHGDGLVADCLKCHTNLTSGSLLGSAANGPGTCQTCHFQMDINDHLNDHDATGFDATPLNNGKSCFTCHADKINLNSGHYGNLSSGGQPIDCSTCHDLSHQAIIDQGKAGTTVFCADCHAARAATHPITPDHQATGLVTGNSTCNSCHDPAANLDIINDIHNANCNNCHSTSVFSQLTGTASGRTGLSSTCIDCHTLRAANYTNHSPASHAVLGITSGCNTASCHPGSEIIIDIHLNHCDDCHTPLSGFLIGSASAGGLTCANCHVSRDSNNHLSEHNLVVFESTPAIPCTNCHLTMTNTSGDHLGKIIKRGEVNGATSIGTVVGCPSCHNSISQQVTDSIASGITGATVTCGECHGFRDSSHPDEITPSHTTSGYLTPTTECASCHNPDGLLDILKDIHKDNCSLCHLLSDFSILTGSASGRKGAAPNTCISCHQGYTPDFNQPAAHLVKDHSGVTATPECEGCHNDADIITGTHDQNNIGGSYSCDRCHTPLSGALLAGVTGDASNHRIGTPSDCIACHPSYNQNYTAHTSSPHSALTMTTGCESCHSATTAPFISSDTHTSCDSCHTPGTGVLIGSATGGPGACIFCHSAVQTVDPHVDQHDYTRFDNTPSLPCADCHVENVALEHAGRSGATGPITCSSCHVDTSDPNYFLFTSLIGWGKDKISIYCRECHQATPNVVPGSNGYRSTDHPNDVLPDHEQRGFVLPTAACVTCHDSNNTKDMISDIHQSNCNLCHDPQGYNLINSASGREGLLNGCIDCHSSYFDAHNHDHSTSIALGAGDISQTGNRVCSECHQDFTGDSTSLDSWSGIIWEHDNDTTKDGIGACATCHDSNRDTSKSGNHTIGKSIQDVISDSISYPSPVNCGACHIDKISPNLESAHGHLATDFVWDGNCAICHAPSGTATVNIINDIHNGAVSCMACHSTAKGGGTLIIGPSSSGIDGTATGGTVLSSCTGCHMVTEVAGVTDTAKSGTIHHISKNGYATAGLCTYCHKANGDTSATKLNADHTTSIALYSGANGCDPCHADFTGTGGPDDRTHGTSTGAIIDADYTVSDNTKVHDTCTTCHNVDGSVFPYITDPNDLMADGYDPRGKASDCVSCHGTAIGPAHRYVDHTGKITTTPDCQWCHADQIGGPNGATISVTDNLVHDDCTTCHEPDMSLHPYTPANPSPRHIVTAMDPSEGGTCNKCHVGRAFDEHRNIDHSLMVKAPTNATGVDNCVSCHDHTAAVYYGPYDFSNYPDPVSASNGGGGVPVDLDPATFDDPKVHDECYYCHQLTGQLKAPADVDPQIIVDMPGWDDTILNNGGGECQNCHGNYFSRHDHGDGPNASVRTNISHNVSVGLDQSAGQDCIICHSGQVESWGNILGIHTDCITCHDSTRTIKVNASFSSVADVIVQGGTTLAITCLDCHANTAVDHVTDHSLFVQTESLCTTTCHTETVLGGIHTSNGCTTCHDATYPPVVLKGSATGHETGPNTCTTCHPNYFTGHTHNHGTSEVLLASSNVPSENCDGCHIAVTSPFIGVGEVHESGCGLCHNSTDGQLISPAITGGGECAACHTTYFTSHIHGTGSQHYVSVGSDQSTGQDCLLCHIGEVENWGNILVTHTDCTICHDSSRSTNVAPSFSSVADVIIQGGSLQPITCLDCHDDKAIDHTPSHTFYVEANSDCTSCHQESDLLLGVHPVSGTTTTGCTTCHSSAILPIGTLLGSASGHSGATTLNPNTCDVCHFSSYSSHTSDTHGAMVLTTTDLSCERCHTATTSPFIGATEPHNPQGCTTCHTATGALQGSALNHTIGTPSNCAACHLGNDPIDHVAEHDMTAFDTTPPLTCSNCHSSMSNINSGHMGLPSDMGTIDCNSCHAYSGSKLLKSNIDTAIANARSSAGSPVTVYCSDCHGARATDHPNDIMPPHTFLLKNVTSCELCHDQSGSLDIVAEIHRGNCLNCHDATYTSLIQGTYGDATLHGAIGVGNTSDCLKCHPDHALAYTFHGSDTHTTNTKTTVDNSCDSCHIVGIAPFSGTGEPHAAGCTLCHNSDGTLIGSALNHNVGSPSDCQTCHFSDYASHTSDTHTANVTTTVNSCDNCHTATISPFTGAGEPHAAGCSLCHAANGSLQGSATGHTLGAASSCQDCHFSDYTSHSSDTHAMNVIATTDNSCDSCHVANTAPFTGVGEPHTAGCSLCHDVNGNLQGSAATNHTIGAPSDCQGCHFSSYSAHTSNTHNLVATTTDNTCESCHPTSTPPFIGASEPHAQSCTLCHNSNGSLKGSAADHTIGQTSNCQNCHFSATAYNSHTSNTHGVNVLSTSDNSCDSCHTTSTSPFSGIGEPHNSGCSLCHNSSGTLIGSASSNHTVRNPSDCQGCHFSSYTSHTSDTHSNLHNTSDNSCDSCHNAITAPFTGVGEPHAAGCTLCHNANGSLSGSALNHTVGGISTCEDCHFTATSYSSHSSNTHPTTVTATINNSCESCHLASTSPFDGVGEDHQTGCTLCHDTNGRLIGSATGHIIGTTSNCQDCHFTSYNSHTSNSHALNVTATVDNSCESCHIASTSPFDGVGEAHETGCTLCHDGNGALLGSAATNHTVGSPSNCQECHFTLYNSHSSDTHGAMITATSDNSCDSCHIAATAPFTTSGEVHQTGCTLCHDSNGKLIGSATNHTIGNVSDCQVCHFGLYSSHQSDSHSMTVTTTTDNSCDSCHIATSSPFTGAGEVHEAGCALCHNNNGSLKGSAATHIIGSVSSCQDCHFATYTSHSTDSHGTTITPTIDNSCDSCHLATIAPFVGSGQVHETGCTLCHYDNGSLKGSAATNHIIGQVSDCQGCHFTAYTSHTSDSHAINVLTTTDNSCERCHTASTSPFSSTGEVHETGCALCHNTNGSLTGSASTYHTVGNPSDCQGCHFTLFSSHTSDTHSVNVLATTDSSCDSCHQAATSPFIGVSEPHTTGCALCHDLTGALIGSASSNHVAGTPSDCQGCHFSGYTTHTSDTHAVNVTTTTDNSCESCHVAVISPFVDVGEVHEPASTFGGPPFFEEITGPCTEKCHNSNGSLIGSAGTNHVVGSVSNCQVCHFTAYTSHTQDTHGTMVTDMADSSCNTCHTATTSPFTTLGEVHELGCTLCHSSNGSLIGSTTNHNVGTASNCQECHQGYFDAHGHLHDVAYNSSTDLAQSDSSGCQDCHGSGTIPFSLATWSDILFEHDVPTNGSGSCATCHNSSRKNSDDSGRITINPLKYITADPSVAYVIANGTTVECLDCHYNKKATAVHEYLAHNTDNGLGYAPLIETPECVTCHPVTGDTIVSGVHKNTCQICHTTISAPVGLHTTPNLQQFSGASVSCVDCHQTTNNSGFSYNFHGLSWSDTETMARHNNLESSDFSGLYSCNFCHDITTPQSRLILHMGVDTPFNCLRCHTPSTYNGAVSDLPAITVIANGKSNGGNTVQTCENCHTSKGVYRRHGLADDTGPDSAADVHNNLWAESGSATSTCSSCHNASSAIENIQLHTSANGTGSGYCTTCHGITVSNSDMDPGQGVITLGSIIAAGEGLGGSPQYCDNCHIDIGSDWYQHTPPDHGTAMVLPESNCTICHDTDPGTNTTAPNTITSPYIGATENHAISGCATCHSTAGLLTAKNGNYTTTMAQGSCTTCHTTYFDGHSHGTLATGHDLSFNSTNDKLTTGESCNTCHGTDGSDAGTAILDNWDEILSLHGGSCTKCHNYDGTNGVYNTTPVTDVRNAISSGIGVECITCHTYKIYSHTP